MAVDDLWLSSRRGPDGERLRTKRYGRGKRWRVRYTDDTGRSREPLFEKRSDAVRFDNAVNADLSRGQYIDPDHGKVTVAAHSVEWRKQQLWDVATAERVERAFRLHIIPPLGHMQLGRVRTSHVKGWVKDRSQALAPSTLRVVYSYLVAMFGAAAMDRLIGVSPCNRSVTLPEVDNEGLFVPSATQVEALGAALPDRYRAQPVTAAATGLRQGEVWGLELDHVDFLRRKVRVVQQLKVVQGGPPFLAPPKTKLSRRDVELSVVGAEALAHHLELFPVAEVEVEDRTDPRNPVWRKAKLIFTNMKGKPISRQGWSHTWTPAVARTDLPQGFGFHGLRHFYATVLIHGGASVKTVQEALGHATPMITLNTYVGHWPDAVDTTRGLIDAAFGRQPARRLEVVG